MHKFKRYNLYVIFLILLNIPVFAADITGYDYHLVILHTNDTHGHPVGFYEYPSKKAGGLPARATIVEEIRRENKYVLVLDAGDLNTGRAESNLFKAEPDIIGYNYIHYDAIAIGNHEFDNPLDVLIHQIKSANFPFLSANIEGDIPIKPYIIKDFDGLKVAIFGLTTKETAEIGNPSNIKGIVFADEIMTAKKIVPVLRKEADLIIALVHMGLYDNDNKGSRRLAKEVNGIDLIIDGHSHTFLKEPVEVKNSIGGHVTPIVSAWKWGLVIGRVDLWIKDKKVIKYTFKAIPVNLQNKDGSYEDRYIDDDKPLAKRLEPYIKTVNEKLSTVIGTAAYPFGGGYDKGTGLGNLTADSMLWYVQRIGLHVDISIQNKGGIRDSIPGGAITMSSVYNALTFDNTVELLTLKGSDVLQLFDFAAGLDRHKGAYPLTSGKVLIDRRKKTVLIDGVPIDTDREYNIATNSYLANGGDGYKVFLKATRRVDTAVMQRDVLIEYIRGLDKPLIPDNTERFRVQ